jgi:serine protease AprX
MKLGWIGLHERDPGGHMTGVLSRATLCGLALLIAATALPASGAVPDSDAVRAIITFRDGLPTGLEAELTSLGVRDAMGFESIDAVTLTAPQSVLDRYASDPRVLQVRAQRRLRLNLYASVEQIGAQGVEVPETYDIPDRGTFTRPGVSGAGQTIAILDTGIWTGHPDLFDQVVKSLHFEFQYALPSAFTPEQRDLVFAGTGSLANADDWGHGTHVAGIAAGTGESASGRENHGVAPGARLVSLGMAHLQNGLVDDAGWEANAIAAIDWVMRHHDDPEFGSNGIRIVNNSWSLTGTDLIFGAPQYDPLKAIIQQVVSKGVVMVFAAGNGGPGPVGEIPNAMPEVITVANACKAADSCGNGKLNSTSSRGPSVDVAAPGSNIISASLPASLVGALGQLGGNYGATQQDQIVNRAFYTSASGTSMAAPHISGVVALMLQVNPALTPAQILAILSSTATDKGPAGHDDGWGHGLVNVRKALIEAHKTTLPPISA